MGYYTRVFCTTKNKPTVNGILEYLKSEGLTVETNQTMEDMETVDWTGFELMYAPERLPLLVELNQIGSSDGLAEEEIEEFLEFVGDARFYEPKKKKVIAHLKQTEYIICIQFPTNDIVEQGYDANGELMSFFESNYSGMIQADREGFYGKNNLLEKLD